MLPLYQIHYPACQSLLTKSTPGFTHPLAGARPPTGGYPRPSPSTPLCRDGSWIRLSLGGPDSGPTGLHKPAVLFSLRSLPLCRCLLASFQTPGLTYSTLPAASISLLSPHQLFFPTSPLHLMSSVLPWEPSVTALTRGGGAEQPWTLGMLRRGVWRCAYLTCPPTQTTHREARTSSDVAPVYPTSGTCQVLNNYLLTSVIFKEVEIPFPIRSTTHLERCRCS